VDGETVSICTLWRWCRKGLRGAFLEYVRVGRKTSLRRGCRRQVCTTREGMLRFFTEAAELDERTPHPEKTGRLRHVVRRAIRWLARRATRTSPSR